MGDPFKLKRGLGKLRLKLPTDVARYLWRHGGPTPCDARAQLTLTVDDLTVVCSVQPYKMVVSDFDVCEDTVDVYLAGVEGTLVTANKKWGDA